jgi:tetratricopeptide (TPR) repeat protein
LIRLETLHRVTLRGPHGEAALPDPRHQALLARLAAAPGRSVDTDEILLGIWPHLTANQGREQLENAVRTVARAAGEDLVTETEGRWTLAHRVECDIDTMSGRQADGFVRGLSLPDTPEWDAWVATARRELALRPAASEQRRRVPRLAVLAIGALVIAAGGYLATRPRIVAGFNPGDRVILADIANATGDSTLGRSIQVAAVVGLQQSPRLELYPPSRVLESLRSSGRTASLTGLSLELAFEVAARDRVPWVVAIAVEPAQNRSTITTRLFRAERREAVVTTSAAATGTLGLVEAVDRTLRTLQRRIGEPGGRVSQQPSLAFATTSDFEALRAYTAGAAAWNQHNWREAFDYWERAVALDTGFALAMGSLGAAYYYQHDRANGERYYRMALARRGRLTEWERLRLESNYATARGDNDSALAISRRTAESYPRATTFYNLGTDLLVLDRCPEALEALNRSRELDPSYPPTLINIATCHKRSGDFDAARTAYLGAGRLDSNLLYRGNVNMEFATTLLLGGRVAEAESALARMARRREMTDQALGYRGLGFLALWRGEIARSREHFRRAAETSRQQRAVNSLIRNLALLTAADRAAGDRLAVHRNLNQIDSLARIPGLAVPFLTFAVDLHADEGDASRAAALLELMRQGADPRNREDSAHLGYVAGTVALTRQDPAAALAAFQRAGGFRFGVWLALRRAAALEQLGRLDSAVAVMQGVLANPNFGFEDQIAWLRALIEVGDLEERLGRTENAIASYRRFLEQWKDSDPGLPDVIRVRGRLTALLDRGDRVP